MTARIASSAPSSARPRRRGRPPAPGRSTLGTVDVSDV